MLRSHSCRKVEEVVWLDIAAFDGRDSDAAVRVVEAGDLINSGVESLSVLAFRLAVHVCLLYLVHLGGPGLGVLVLTLRHSLGLGELNHLEDLGWVCFELCGLSDHLLACFGWLPCLLIISRRVLFFDVVVVELLKKDVSTGALVRILSGHVGILEVFFGQAEVSEDVLDFFDVLLGLEPVSELLTLESLHILRHYRYRCAGNFNN